MKIEKIEKVEQGELKPMIIVTFECADQQEFDEQIRALQHISDTRLLAVVGGYRVE